MKNDMEKIDELIKQALSKEEAAFYDDLDEQNLLQKMGSVHRGKNGWLAVIMNMVHLVIFGFFIYSVVRFFNAHETNELIKWASAGFICFATMGMIKLFMWMQMDKNDILRELKRLELQVSVLSGKIK